LEKLKGYYLLKVILKINNNLKKIYKCKKNDEAGALILIYSRNF
jgi:hypothetical protein